MQLLELIQADAALRREIREEKLHKLKLWKDLIQKEYATKKIEDTNDGEVKGMDETLLDFLIEQDELLKKLAMQHAMLTKAIDGKIPGEEKGVNVLDKDDRETKESPHSQETSVVNTTATKPQSPSSASSQPMAVTQDPIPIDSGTKAPPAHYDGELALSVLKSSSVVGNEAMTSSRWYEEEERKRHYSSSTFEDRLKRKLAESRRETA